jgi:hypothetical protein
MPLEQEYGVAPHSQEKPCIPIPMRRCWPIPRQLYRLVYTRGLTPTHSRVRVWVSPWTPKGIPVPLPSCSTVVSIVS